MKRFFTAIIFVFFAVVLLLGLRGIAGNPTSQTINESQWKDEGPFELSPERGRFALALSVIENNSFSFSLPIAHFATPDLGYKDGKYVSLFAPLVSFLIIPGYQLGSSMGLGQVGVFSIIALFALLDAFFVYKIAKKLGANRVASLIGSLLFLFATPAFAYSVSLYQHAISAFLILFALYALISWRSIWSAGLIWFLCAASIPLDYPNLFLMAPIGIAALLKNFSLEKVQDAIKIKIKFLRFFALITLLIPLAFFMWFNHASYGNPLQLSGTVASVKAIDAKGKPVAPKTSGENEKKSLTDPTSQNKSATAFFQTRNLLNGFYIHFASPDRGMFWYTPVVFFSVLGIIYLYQKKEKILPVLLGIMGVNIVLYSMWGDPWGGWAFGSRYLFPSYAIAAILVSYALTVLRKKFLFLLFFFIVLAYSISVNTLGAITSSRNPPLVEVLGLEKLTGTVQKYTYERNFDYLKANKSKSFVWQTYGKQHLSSVEYYLTLTGSIVTVSSLLLFFLGKEKKVIK